MSNSYNYFSTKLKGNKISKMENVDFCDHRSVLSGYDYNPLKKELAVDFQNKTHVDIIEGSFFEKHERQPSCRGELISWGHKNFKLQTVQFISSGGYPRTHRYELIEHDNPNDVIVDSSVNGFGVLRT